MAMDRDRALFPHPAKMGIAGGLIWLMLVTGTLFGSFRLTIFDLLFLLAPWVVVPLALSLVPASSASRITRIRCHVIRYLLPPGAALTTVSFFLPEGRRAGALTCLWLLVAVGLGVDGLARVFRTRFESFEEFCFAIGEGYALVGALWLVASRAGLRPAGFREPIVLLTAIHFHYAGLMTAVLAGLANSETEASRPRLALPSVLSCAVLGPGLLALAFLVGPRVKLAAVVLIVIGEFGLAIGTFRVGLREVKKVGGRLLLMGGGCVIFGMALAGIWAVGEYPLHAFVNLEQMARYHGVLNSIGFGLGSLLGWTLLGKKSYSVLELS